MILEPIIFPNTPRNYDVYAVCTDGGKCNMLDFLLSVPDKDRRKIMADIKQVIEYGPDSLSSKRSHFMDQSSNIYQFTGGSQQTRVGWFRDDDRLIICTHGFTKKKNTTPNNQKVKARAIKQRYLSAKGKNTLIFKEEE